MIDTINLEYKYRIEEKQRILDFIESNLEKHSTTKYHNERAGSSLIAKSGCFTFIMGPARLKIVGSLTTDVMGNNIYNSTYDDIKVSIGKLKKLLSFIDVYRLRFTRIDIAYNFILKCSLNRYLPILQCPDGFKHVEHKGESLMFDNKNFKLKFYDKIKECKANGHLPFKYRGLNMLRYEMVLKSGGLKGIGLHDLCLGSFDEDDYFRLADFWFNRYLLLPKVEDQSIQIPAKPSLKTYKDFAVKFLLSNLDGRCLDEIFMKNTEMSSKNRFILKKYKSELGLEFNTNGNLCAELVNLIVRAYGYAIPDSEQYYPEAS